MYKFYRLQSQNVCVMPGTVDLAILYICIYVCILSLQTYVLHKSIDRYSPHLSKENGHSITIYPPYEFKMELA